MTTLFRNGTVINVFTGEMEKANVLIENGTIIGVGDYDEGDETIDLTGKFLAPGLIDSHIHIESTMLLPYEFAHAVLPVYLKNILKIEKKYFLTLKNYSATKFAFNQMKLHYRFFIKEKKIKKKLKII